MNLFRFSRSLFLSVFFLFAQLLITELAVVDDATYRRLRIGRNLNQVKIGILRDFESILTRHNAKLFPMLADQTNLLVSDLLVNQVIANGLTPPKKGIVCAFSLAYAYGSAYAASNPPCRLFAKRKSGYLDPLCTTILPFGKYEIAQPFR